jgi:hypothetical protein
MWEAVTWFISIINPLLDVIDFIFINLNNQQLLLVMNFFNSRI